jgi:asparagine synthase (glutamine-hydrolysing)
VGILLSGGLDSGAAASTAALLLRNDDATAPELRPYSWASPSLPEIDERLISQHIVNEFGLHATDVPVDGAWPLDDYPAHGPHRDEPMVGAYQALIERSLAMARNDGVRVMLSGDRGDLTMGGWSLDYVAMASDRQWGLLREELETHRRATGESMGAILARFLVRPAWGRLRRRGFARAVRRISRPANPAAAVEAPPWVSDGLPDREPVANAFPEVTMPRWSQQRRFDEIFSVFQMRGMLWSERTYARHGLVFADPWSDRRIAEFALSLPQQIVDRPGEGGKRLVRAAMAGVMPEPARLQAKKIPATPLFRAAVQGPGQAAARDLLRATRLEDLGLVDGAKLRSGFEHYLGGDEPGGDIWRAMAAEWWLRTY